MSPPESEDTKRHPRSWFIFFWGWFFVLAASFFLLISIVPNVFLFLLYSKGIVDSATFPAHNLLEVVFYSNLRVFAALSTLLNLLWLLGAIGMLRRMKWSRPLLTVVLGIFALGLLMVLANFLAFDYEITAWRDLQRNERLKALFLWFLGSGILLLAGLLYRLNSGNIIRKLS